jgi:2-C-methyl-D-erythritol 4-phosphate cytidylyltransferase
MVWVVVVAAGRGERYGAPKQYELIAGRRVLDWSLDAARVVAGGIVLVVAPGREADHEDVDAVVVGGATRSASVRAGLAAVPADASIVVVHDAARPAADGGLFDAVVRAVLDGADAAVPGVTVVDTVKRVGADGVVVETLDRDELVAVQTPQAFKADVLRAAHAGAGDASDDAALVEAAGGRVVVVPGDLRNIKLTTAADRARLEDVLR